VLVRVGPDQVPTTYGLLVLGKVAALMVLGVIGWLHRRGTVAAVVERGDRPDLVLGSPRSFSLASTSPGCDGWRNVATPGRWAPRRPGWAAAWSS
jgi:hypothetical protein